MEPTTKTETGAPQKRTSHAVMQHLTRSVTRRLKMASVRVRHGSEGPEHDPYSYTEITFYFTNPKRKPVTYHGGLGDWVKHGKRKYGFTRKKDLSDKFEELTGLSVRRAEMIPDMLFERSMRKYSKHERWQIMECIEADNAMLRNCY
jgi:hypothetical protein